MANVQHFQDTPVSWQIDDIDVNASLTRPSGTGPFPAVIMVAGSGPTDRNWNSPLIPGTNGSAALLAQALAGIGFVVLRYDKRASGPKGQENAMRMMGKISMQAHLEELAGGVRLLADRPDVKPDHIFVLSNSEGNIHALSYQTRSPTVPFAGLVLTAPPVRPVGALAHAQIAAQLAAVPGGDAMLLAYDAAIADFLAGRPVNIDQNLPQGLQNVILSVTNPINQPFSRELWTMDPLALFAMITAPTLVVIGKKDIQVDWQIDGALLEPLIQKRANSVIVYPENANHVLKHEPKPRSQLTAAEVMTTYSGENTPLDPETVEIISSWLRAHI
jgi:pimeloyl-ACP methyl ester carboxylesterase